MGERGVGVDGERLADAARQLLDSGRPLTVRALREATQLRTATVADWLRQHRGDYPAAAPVVPAALADAATDAVAGWWKAARTVLDEEYGQRFRDLSARAQAADLAAARADEARSLAEERAALAAARARDATARVEELTRDLTHARAELTQARQGPQKRGPRRRYWQAGS